MRNERRVDGILRGPRAVAWASALGLALAVILVARAAPAQYEIEPSKIGAGGGTLAGAQFDLTGTIGQVDAGYTSNGGFGLYGGFWPAVAFVPEPTPTSTATPPHTVTVSPTHTATRSPTAAPPPPSPTVPHPSPTVTASASATVRTPTPTGAPSVSPTAPPPSGTLTPSPTPTRIVEFCAGDCAEDGEVTVDDLVTMTSIALGLTPLGQCPAGDANGDGEVTVDDLLVAVIHALDGCPVAAPAAPHE
ncbi:dockerin type I repeat-containing protein [Candidatus Binatia bacterium]|nr:dockerin type I repeat-containing protein [Candidatus Binatia bacterium]